VPSRVQESLEDTTEEPTDAPSGEREELQRPFAGRRKRESSEDSEEERECASPTEEDQEPGRDAHGSEEEEEVIEEHHGHGSDGEDSTSEVLELAEDSKDKDNYALSTSEELTSSISADGLVP